MTGNFKGPSSINFINRFPNKEKCKLPLSKIEWKSGFVCIKCNNHIYWKPKDDLFHRVCKSCRHNESVTANTLFHKVKFDLREAFFIILEMSTPTKSCSCLVMARKYEINKKPSWLLKVRKAMASSSQYPLNGECKVA